MRVQLLDEACLRVVSLLFDLLDAESFLNGNVRVRLQRLYGLAEEAYG